MVHAAAYIAQTNAAAQDWARARIARTLVRAVMHCDELVYHRTWPAKDLIDPLTEIGADPALARDGWLHSTLDLRHGLSVVEVFAAGDEPEELLESALIELR